MLKLEKTGRSSQITVRIREKEPFFNSFLVKAFLIALSMHLVLFFIFHIQPFFIEGQFLYPPVQVHMDRLSGSSLTVLDEEFGDELRALPPPPLAMLFDPPFQTIDPHTASPWSDADADADAELWRQPFASLENRLISASYVAPELEIPIPMTYSPIKVMISGDLAERSLLDYDARLDEKHAYQAGGLPEPQFASYRVQLDEESGMLFWYERQRFTGNPEMDALTEELLGSFKFLAGGTQPTTSGTVDFVLQGH